MGVVPRFATDWQVELRLESDVTGTGEFHEAQAAIGGARRRSRDRVNTELRGLGEQLHALAQARRLTTAAVVRQALMQLLADVPDRGNATFEGLISTSDDQIVKVTLRPSEAHAVALATRARAADIAQGAYVAGLIDGKPPAPLPPDHTDAIAALTRSPDHLAAISTDLNAFMRLPARGSSLELEHYRAGVMSLVDDIRRHLTIAAPLVAVLKSARTPR